MTATQEATTIRLADINLDESATHCQIRGCTDSTVVEEYAAQMLEGVLFPPVHVITDGTSFWLVDGFHRAEAAADAGLSELPCIIHEGSLRDAILYAVGANTQHGLRRSNADKRAAVLTLLNDDAWCKWSDRKIARQCGVSHNFVSDLRKRHCHPMTDSPKKVERNGTTYEMQTANIGAKPNEPTPSPLEDPRPLPPKPSGVPSELTYDETDHNEEAPTSFVDEVDPNENRIGYFAKTLNDQLDQFIAQGDYPSLLTVHAHLEMALEKVGLAMDELKEGE